MNEYPCPECGEAVPVYQDDLNYTSCTHCNCKLIIDVDAEFKDGMWHDLTKLIKDTK